MGWLKGRPRSAEVRAKIAATLKARLASDPELVRRRAPIGRIHSAETRTKIASAHLGLRHTDDSRKKMSVAKTGRKHTDQFKAIMSSKMKGRTFSDETRKKLSVAGMGHQAWHAKGKQFWYGAIRMRSSWEVRVARSLDALGVKWEYEPRRFHLGVSTYTPDFYLPEDGAFWEVKGWFSPESQKKVAAFREKFQDIPLVLFTKSCVDALDLSAARKAA